MKEIERMIFILLWIICTACNSGKPSAEFDRLEQLMPHHPDSVLQALESMDTLHWSERERSYYYLLQTEAEDKCYVEHTTDSLISWAADYFRRKDDRAHYDKALYLQGRIQSDLSRTPEALFSFLQAKDVLKDIHEYALKGRVYENLGRLYWNYSLYEEAAEMYEQSKQAYAADCDTMGILYVSMKQGDVFLALQSDAQSLSTYQTALELSHYLQDVSAEADMLTAIGNWYAHQQQDSLALSYLKQAERISVSEDQTVLYFSLASTYHALSESDSAMTYVLRSVSSDNLYTRCDSYRLLYELYAEKGQWKDAYLANQSYWNTYDSIERLLGKDKMADWKRLYREKEIQNQLLEIRHQKEKRQYYTALTAFIVFVLVVSLWNKWKRRIKEKERLLAENQAEIHKRDKRLNELRNEIRQIFGELSIERDNYWGQETACNLDWYERCDSILLSVRIKQAEMQKLENELADLKSEQEKLLMESHTNSQKQQQALALEEENRVLQETIERHIALYGAIKEEHKYWMQRLIELTPVLNKILNKDLKHELDEEEWRDLEHAINQLFKGFVDKLRKAYPDITLS